MSEASLQLNAPKMAVTVDEEQIFHMISDQHLMYIERHGRGHLFDFFLVLLGASIGLVKDFLSAAAKISAKSPIEAGEAAAAIVFVAAAAGALALYFASKSDRSSITEICTQIRARPSQRGQQAGS